MNSTAALFARLASISASLATWNGQPAIFNDRAPDAFLSPMDANGDPLPGPAKPFLIIAAPSRDEASETLTETGRLIVQDVRGYQRDTGSSTELDTLMRAVRDLFHNQPQALTVTGGVCDICRVTGPVQAPVSDEALNGRRVTIRLDLRNT